jgi:hypothetical protein
MRITWMSLIVLVTGLSSQEDGQPPEATPPRVFRFNGARIAEARRRIARGDERLAEALQRLRSGADEAMRTPVLSVVERPQEPPK